MFNFVIGLDPTTKEELYSDESETFMGFMLIEALMVMMVVGKPDVFTAIADMEVTNAHDFSCQYDTSIDYLLDLNQYINEQAGIFLPDEEYGYNSDRHGTIAAKLDLAIQGIELFNDLGFILSLKEYFEAPDIVGGFRFTCHHYPDRAAFCVLPSKSEDDSASALDDLIEDYERNCEGNENYWLDPSVLSMQNYLFNQRS